VTGYKNYQEFMTDTDAYQRRFLLEAMRQHHEERTLDAGGVR